MRGASKGRGLLALPVGMPAVQVVFKMVMALTWVRPRVQWRARVSSRQLHWWAGVQMRLVVRWVGVWVGRLAEHQRAMGLVEVEAACPRCWNSTSSSSCCCR